MRYVNLGSIFCFSFHAIFFSFLMNAKPSLGKKKEENQMKKRKYYVGFFIPRIWKRCFYEAFHLHTAVFMLMNIIIFHII